LQFVARDAEHKARHRPLPYPDVPAIKLLLSGLRPPQPIRSVGATWLPRQKILVDKLLLSIHQFNFLLDWRDLAIRFGEWRAWLRRQNKTHYVKPKNEWS